MASKTPDYSTWALRTARKATTCDKCDKEIRAGSRIRHSGKKRIHASHVRNR